MHHKEYIRCPCCEKGLILRYSDSVACDDCERRGREKTECPICKNRSYSILAQICSICDHGIQGMPMR